MNRQDPWISQTAHRRVVVEGRLHPGGGICTVLFEETPDGWLLHPFGLTKGSVRLSKADVRRAAQQLLGGQS